MTNPAANTSLGASDSDLLHVRRSFIRHLAADRRKPATRSAYGDRLEDVERANSLVHGLFARPVTEDDLATFLELAGFVESAPDAPSHPNWERWLAHRMALSWQGEKLDHPERSVDEMARITCRVLLTKGTRTAVTG